MEDRISEKTSEIVKRLPKEFIFLQLNENEFEVVKSALEEESF